MGESDPFSQRVMSGEARGAGAALLRCALSIAQPFYAGTMRMRNGLYNSGILRARRLPRPVICVGNITTGGTGKTPVVRWLSAKLRDQGMHPAILLRGYKSANGLSDEEALHQQDGIVVTADACRHRGGTRTLAAHPQTDVFILDDGFQHRRLARDFDLVLIDATRPFGFGHVLPRGLLREPLSGLRRAHAILVTRASQADASQLAEIERVVRSHNPAAPILHSDHVHTGLIDEHGTTHPLEVLRTRRLFAFAGIGNPAGLDRQLRDQFGASYAGHRWFEDHHAYADQDLTDLRRAASDARADVLLTTEKDWVKVRPASVGATPASRSTRSVESIAAAPHRDAGVAPTNAPPIWRIAMEIRFREGDEERLLTQIRQSLGSAASRAPAASSASVA